MRHTQLIYTEYLSKSNTVYYINPPKKWEFKNIFHNSLNKINEGSNLTILNYINKFPVFINALNKYNEYYNESKVAKELKKIGAKKILIWHFDSYRSSFSNNFFDKSIIVKRVYHVIDPFYKNPIDRWLCNKSDQIVITSPRNNNYYSEFSEKVINIPQSLDIEHERDLLMGNISVKQKFTENYFVLLGTISDDLDFDWLLGLLNTLDFKLIIVGKVINLTQTDKLDRILKHSNVDYRGVLSPDEFYPILKKAIAGMIVYNEERRLKVCSPLKALNYIISELPVITNIDCEIPELKNNSIYYTEDINRYNELVKLALNRNLKIDQVAVDDYLNNVSMFKAICTIVRNLSDN
jgi:hypothetical protein